MLQEWGKQEKRCCELCRHQEGDAVAGSWVRPAGGGCQRLQPRWMRGEEGAGGQQTAAATEGGRASSQHEETAEGQLDRESEKA